MQLTNQNYFNKTEAELNYILKDASEAARSVRSFDSRAEAKYLEQVCDATTVLGQRARTHLDRTMWSLKEKNKAKRENVFETIRMSRA